MRRLADSIIHGDACVRTGRGPRTGSDGMRGVNHLLLLGMPFFSGERVAGLRRTGKSCRLRWVNYLHPGLRRGRITADEERLILELHAQWGSRWSRIARSLPGRTDNEIKNFWRTRTRKKALEQRRHGHGDGKTASPSSSSSSVISGSSGSSSPVTESSALQERSGDDQVELELEEATTTTAASQHHNHQQQYQEEQQHGYCSYTMDQLWNEIAAAEAAAASYVVDSWGAAVEMMPSSPVWEFCPDYSLWRIDDDEYYKKMLDAS
ncbi:hypothetical protein EJB05_34337, partial [Eragrostis curvula]